MKLNGYSRTFFVAPVVARGQAKREVIFLRFNAKLTANLHVVSESIVVGAFSTGKPHLAVDVFATHRRNNGKREGRRNAEAGSRLERLLHLRTDREFHDRGVSVFNGNAVIRREAVALDVVDVHADERRYINTQIKGLLRLNTQRVDGRRRIGINIGSAAVRSDFSHAAERSPSRSMPCT